MGLGLGNMYMSSGMDYVSQNTLYSDYGRSLMSDLTNQNGTSATMAGITVSIPGPDQWALASPADRLKIGLENGIYRSYTLVGAYKTKRQVGQRDNAENGETDDFITGYEFHYETNDGNQFKSYINAHTDYAVVANAENGAQGHGHNALLIGNEQHGYQFLSKEGRDEHAGGSSNNAASGGPALKAKDEKFSTFAKFLLKEKFSEYNRFYFIPISHSTR